MSRLSKVFSFCILVSGIFFTRNVLAHPLDLGYFHAELDKSDSALHISLELNPSAAEIFSGIPLHTLNEPSTNLKSAQIINATLKKILVQSGAAACHWNDTVVKWIDEQQIRILGSAHCPEMEPSFNFQFQFLDKASSTFQILGKFTIVDSQIERSFLLEKSNPNFALQSLGDENPHFLQFIGMGIKHIGATPSEWINQNGLHFPDGIDHILFILALILGGGGFINLLKTATGFTLGHSITLALASMGWVTLPSRWVESAIALSIVFVAIEALLSKDSRGRWKVAMAFGLVHGFGFATALQELNLSRKSMLEALVGFNCGVELGQIVILALVVPIVLWAKDYSKNSLSIIRVCAAFIAVIGSYWFVNRAFAL